MIKEDCVFCNIGADKMPAKIVYQDEIVIAFLDTDPVAAGHTLVIPKNHSTDILDIPVDTLKHIVEVTQKISLRIKESLDCTGLNIMMNNKKETRSQENHFHVHIIPRKDNDGIKMMNMSAPPEQDLFAQMDEILNKIKTQ